jgi:hypothetical protein
MPLGILSQLILAGTYITNGELNAYICTGFTL